MSRIPRDLLYSVFRYGIISADIIRAEVCIGDHTISRSDYGIISADIMRAEVCIGDHTI